MTNLGQRTVRAEFHEAGQSMHNSDVDWTTLIYMEQGQEVEINLKPVMSIRINTRNHPCNVTNTHSVTQSVNDFISERIGCRPPWTKNRQRNQPKDWP